MKIRFGLKLDAGNWPEFEPGCDAMIGDVVLGPQGLVSLLETHLGIGSEQLPQALRIRQFMGRLIESSAPKHFFSTSFEADAWAVARELLTWRDELIFYGWNPAVRNQPERLSDLASLDLANADLSYSGFPDRFRSVLNAVREDRHIPVSSIILLEPLDLMPAPWKDLFAGLQECGVSIEDAKSSGRSGNLEEIVLLEAEHEWPLAQAVASLLKAKSEDSSAVILCQHESGKLDQAMKFQGLPQTGQGEESAQKGVLQLLPLVLENIWKPTRIEQLIELLSAPLSPVPGFAARKLTRVLARKPGLESDEWHKAIEEIAADKCKYLIQDGSDQKDAEKEADDFAAKLDRWLRLDRVGADMEAPAAIVTAAIEHLRQHLARLTDAIPMASAAMGHCRDLALILSGLGKVSKPLLDRIVDDVIGPGRSAGSVREASAWGVIRDPAQLTGNVETMIWWGFTDPSSPASTVWSQDELNWLLSAGVRLDSPSLERSRQHHHWLASMQRCKRVLFCKPTERGGNPTTIHPLWAELKADPLLDAKRNHIQAMRLFNQPKPSLLGLNLSLLPAESATKTVPVAIKRFDEGVFSGPDKLSPTSLNSLFGCSFKWLLEELGVEASDMMSIQSESAMVGTLAHQVLEDVFIAGKVPRPEDAAIQASDAFVVRVPQMAADLLLPENKVEYEDVQERVSMAARDLSQRFSEAGFERLMCEEWIHTTLDGIKVNGRADVIAYSKNDEPHVIDFKYSYGRNYYQKMIAKGRDIQLITYSRMIDNKPKPVAYYLIPIQKMVTSFPAFKSEVIDTDESLNEGWEHLRKTFSYELAQLRKGYALATGLVDETELEQEREENGRLHVTPPCRFCGFAAICGLNGEQGNA